MWTMRAKGMAVPVPRFERCAPTKAHMCATALHRAGYLSRVVTQNVDGLHGRAGTPAAFVSELHGTVFRETCENEACAVTELVRDFDVTARKPHGGRHRHKTGRACPGCGGDLRDVVVQFGERIDDDVVARATEASRNAKLSLVMGTSEDPARVAPSPALRDARDREPAVDRRGHARHRRCARGDDVLSAVCETLGVAVPEYDPGADAIGARVLAAGETFARKQRAGETDAEATEATSGKGVADEVRARYDGVQSEKRPEVGGVAAFAPLSKRARRMKNPSVPKPTSDGSDDA